MTEFARFCAREEGMRLKDGCYTVWPLPNFETAADIQFTKEAGAMVSGASTVPEQIAANLMGVKCVALAAVSNPCTGTIEGGWTHDG
jgi:purine-nucleoside phosphorylase